MLKMRLQRIGRKNDPTYRILVTDSRRGPKSGRHVDLLGSYNPKQNQVQIDTDRAKEWLAKGVQPSDTVHNLLVTKGVITAPKINALPKKQPIIDEEAVQKATEEAAKAKEVAEEADAPKAEEAEPTTASESAEQTTGKDEAPAEEAKADTEPEAPEKEDTPDATTESDNTPKESEEEKAKA